MGARGHPWWILAVALGCSSLGCSSLGCGSAGEARPAAQPDPALDDAFAQARTRMVREQLEARDIDDRRVLEAMGRVARHEFVPAAQRGDAYADHPLRIGHRQTISQPYIVALMTQLARIEEGDRVLEVGTGSGYQAAVLAEMGAEVWSIEIVEPLAREAAARLARLGYDRVHTRQGDGYRGWPEHAPFDAILITAAPPRIPEPLEAQLAVGGRLVVPVGPDGRQEFVVVRRTETGLDRQRGIPVRFVPMTGEVRRGEP